MGLIGLIWLVQIGPVPQHQSKRALRALTMILKANIKNQTDMQISEN
jgi:hypothetical protein